MYPQDGLSLPCGVIRPANDDGAIPSSNCICLGRTVLQNLSVQTRARGGAAPDNRLRGGRVTVNASEEIVVCETVRKADICRVDRMTSVGSLTPYKRCGSVLSWDSANHGQVILPVIAVHIRHIACFNPSSVSTICKKWIEGLGLSIPKKRKFSVGIVVFPARDAVSDNITPVFCYGVAPHSVTSIFVSRIVDPEQGLCIDAPQRTCYSQRQAD